MKYLINLAVLFVASSSVAQICNDSIEQTAFQARYEIDTTVDSSIATDLATGLTWQRCAVGFVFNDNSGSDDITTHTCDTPTDTTVQVAWNWNQAIERAAQDGSDFRLPNVKELLSLVEFGCHTPAINAEIFPDPQLVGYWTSTPNASTDSAAWSINFSDGADTVSTKNTILPIRLVRD